MARNPRRNLLTRPAQGINIAAGLVLPTNSLPQARAVVIPDGEASTLYLRFDQSGLASDALFFFIVILRSVVFRLPCCAVQGACQLSRPKEPNNFRRIVDVSARPGNDLRHANLIGHLPTLPPGHSLRTLWVTVAPDARPDPSLGGDPCAPRATVPGASARLHPPIRAGLRRDRSGQRSTAAGTRGPGR